MNLYEQRLQEDVEDLTQRVMDVAVLVDRALKNAVHALLTSDRKLASETILGDHRINREVHEIDRRCHTFVVRHLPSARHLRMVSAILRIARELERMGDYAATIGRESAQMKEAPPRNVARAIDLLAEQSRAMVRQTFKAFRDSNAERARGTMEIERQIDATFDKVIADLALEEGATSIQNLFGLMVVLNRLERVSDRAKNICVEIVFWATGEGKATKNFRILFLDEHNGCVSPIAEAFAAKAFPDAGTFSSAGYNAGIHINEHVVAFMDEHGFDLSKNRPKQLETSHDMVSEFHVIVGLGTNPEQHIKNVPFHTVLLEWDVADCPQNVDQAGEVYRDLAQRIRELMETLHGEC